MHRFRRIFGDLKMPHKNPWFIITSEEIAWIRTNIGILEGEVQGNTRQSIDALIGTINTVEHRQR